MRIFNFTWLIPLIISGCATQITKEENYYKIQAPNIDIDQSKDRISVIYYLEGARKSTQSESERLWYEYKLAQIYKESSDPRACALFKNLGLNKTFPLNREATLNEIESCQDHADPNAEMARIDTTATLPWLKNRGLEVSILIAEKYKMHEQLINLYLEKSKQPLEQKEKVEYTKKALNLAIKHFPKEKENIRQRIYMLAPRYNAHPKFSDYLKVAYDHRKNRNFTSALKYYKSVANKKRISHYKKLKALKGISITYKVMGKKLEHIKAEENIAKYVKSRYLKRKSQHNAELLHDSYLSLARANWTQGHIRLAKKTLSIAENLLRKKYSLAQIYLIRGRMSEEVQKFNEALVWYNKALNEPIKDYLKETLLWFKAWNLRKVKKHDEAVEVFKEIIAMEMEEDNKSKYKFWLAKTYKDLKKFEDADSFFEDAIADDPLGYYGLLAHRETHEVLKLPYAKRSIASQNVTTEDKNNIGNFIDTTYLDWLISVGEIDITDFFLDHAMSSMKKQDFVTNEQWLALFHYYAKAGSYLNLFSQLAKIPPQQRKTILAENPDLIFPKPFYDQVSLYASQFGISAEYIYSIMRQESAFNPKARSHMDAFGLMQLLPKVAKKYAKANQVPFKKAEDLFEPKVSIALGAAHLRQLWDNYEGRFILATASYNANKKAIKGWLETRYRGDSLEFIEDIPYQETRNYIKLVLRNLIFYKIVNSPNKVITFPNWALNL